MSAILDGLESTSLYCRFCDWVNKTEHRLYIGLGVGVRMNTVRVNSNDPLSDRWNFPVNLGFVEKRIPNSLSLPSLGADLTFGLAYSINPAISVYTEMGMAKSALQAGLRVGF